VVMRLWGWLAAVLVAFFTIGSAPASTLAATPGYDTAAYTYDAPALLSSPDSGVPDVRVPQSGPVALSWGRSVSVGDRVAAANAGRVFASPDPLVADAANAIESAIPGRVSGVNTMVKMDNGLSREVDVDLGNVVVQVKSGEARGITGQIQRTAASTGRRVVGYAPGMPGQAWEAAARDGVAIARTPQELVAIVKEWG
jgi:hypothetical protein